MKKFIFFIFLLVSTASFAELSCSANGLKVLYINGINVDANGNLTTTYNVQKAVDQMTAQLDKKYVFPVEGVWNTSRGLLNDIDKLKVELAANYQGQKRDAYWKYWARLNTAYAADPSFMGKIDEAIEQITSGKNIPLDKNGNVVDQDYYSKSDYYKDLSKYNLSLANLLANAAADVAVVQQLKTKIKEAYSGGKNKLIVVAHSQGNEVLNSAVQSLRSDTSFLQTADEINKYDGLLGYLQVAPPSPSLVSGNGHAQYVRVNVDAVIGASLFITGINPITANYVYDKYYSSFYKYVDATNWFDKLMGIFTINTGGALFHGMDDIYLSNTFSATRSQNGNSKVMVEHFKDNMREIASKLEDNCNIPIINLSSTEAAADANGVMQVSGFAENGRSITLNVEDIAVDIDPAKALAKGYDRNQTNFTWKIIQNYPLNTSKPLKGAAVVAADGASGNTNQLEVPYRDVTYDVTITATNEFGKTATKTVRFAVAANQAPVVSLSGQQCPIDSNGYNLNGAMTYFLSINDDQYYLDGTVYQRITTQRSFNDIVSDGVDRTTIQVTNSCPIIKPIYHYEIWITCPAVASCTYFYSSCTSAQQADTTMPILNTGQEWGDVKVMNEKNQKVHLYSAWVLNAQILTSTSFPDWNTNQTTRIEVDLGYSCPTGAVATGTPNQAFLRNTIYP